MKVLKMGQFIVEQESIIGGGRIGNFRFKATEDAVSYRTPFFFIHTLSGSVPHISREVFDMIFSPTSKKLPPPIQISIDSTYPFCDVLGSSNRDISSFVGLENCPSFLTVHNPLNEIKGGFNDTKGISIWPRFGRRSLDDKRFAEIISDFKPSTFQALSDYDVSSSSSNRRFKKSTTRTVRCLEEFVKSSSNNNSLLFSTIETAWFTINEAEAKQVLGEILENSNHITGFVLGGLGLPVSVAEVNKRTKNEPAKSENNFSKVDKAEVLSKIIPSLPKDKPIYVPGPFNPEEIIDMVLMGVDMFDSSIITGMAELGHVFLFDLDDYIPKNDEAPLLTVNEGLAGADASPHNPDKSSLLKLKDKKYFDDFSPISSTCDCYTCRRHTKAYINHLFTVNELLGPVLVMTHNLVNFNRFFEAIRHCLQKDREDEAKCMLTKLKLSVKIENPVVTSRDSDVTVENMRIKETL